MCIICIKHIFTVVFPCVLVERVKAADVKVIAALGDSLTVSELV